MAQIISVGAATYQLIDHNDIVIAERTAGLNRTRTVRELETIATERGLTIDQPAEAPLSPEAQIARNRFLTVAAEGARRLANRRRY